MRMLSLIAVPIAFVLVFVSTANAAEDKPSPTIERACHGPLEGRKARDQAGDRSEGHDGQDREAGEREGNRSVGHAEHAADRALV